MASAGPQCSLSLPPSSSACHTLPGAPPVPAPDVQNARGVPLMEPPAPVSARIRSPKARWQWWLTRWRELPSWMMSMVLHLAVTIFFASLAVKVGPQPNALIVLDLSATLAEHVDDDLTTIEVTPVQQSPFVEPSIDSTASCRTAPPP